MPRSTTQRKPRRGAWPLPAAAEELARRRLARQEAQAYRNLAVELEALARSRGRRKEAGDRRRFGATLAELAASYRDLAVEIRRIEEPADGR